MTWQVNQLMIDFHGNRATVSLVQQGTPTAPNDYSSVSVNFPVTDDDKQKEGAAEAALKARTKQLLIDASNSL
jgi:hypothetical protein